MTSIPSENKILQLNDIQKEDFNPKFREIVFKLIEKIEEEISYYGVGGTMECDGDVTCIENVISLSIQQIKLIFCLPQILSNHSNELVALCSNDEIEQITAFIEKYVIFENAENSDDFDLEFHRYLNIAQRNGIFDLIPKYLDTVMIYDI